MQKTGSQPEILRQLYFGLLRDCQQEFLKTIIEKPAENRLQGDGKKLSIGEFLRARKYRCGRPEECTFCGGRCVNKNGRTPEGAQRYWCRECEGTFVDTQGAILKNMRKSLDVWHRYFECMVNRFSLRKSADICGISLPAAFAWRHKILDALQNMMDQVRLEGIVEADETFMAISYKRHHEQGYMPSEPHRRGEKETKRGLSREKVCIPCGARTWKG